MIPGFLMYGTVALLAAPGGKGKSLLAMHTAHSVSTGTPLFWWPAPKGPLPVLLLNGEDDRAEQQRRLYAIWKVTEVDPGDRLISVHAGGPIVLFEQTVDAKTGKKSVKYTPLLRRVVELIEEHEIKLLIVDPLIQTNTGFDENGNNDQEAVLGYLRELARRYDLAVLVVDHTRKGVVSGDQDSIRGGGAKVNSARRAFTLVAVPEDEAAKLGAPGERSTRLVRVGDAKANYAARERERLLEFVPVKLPNGEDWAAAFRVPDDLGPIDDAFDLRSWEHWADFLELVRSGCEAEDGASRPWAATSQARGPKLIDEMVERYGIPDARAREILREVKRRGALIEESWYDPVQRKPRRVWSVAGRPEEPDEVPF